MWKIIAFACAALALGSTPALASNRYDRGHDRNYDRHDRNFDRFDRNFDRYDRDHGFTAERRYRPTWVALGAVELTGRDAVAVRDRGTFTQLRLQTAGAAAFIDRVIVRFADGSTQVTDVGRVLRDRMEILLDGNNRRVDRVIVLGDTRRHGLVEVFAI